jgi:alpha-tubulin suppressor-like RCC1 family protein
LEYDSGNIVKALLYRGTPDNPAFWKRALLDLSFAAAVIAVATGPSGKNDEYLFHLDQFMSNPNLTTSCCDDYHGDEDTHKLAVMIKYLQQRQMYFLLGYGSNQYNQLSTQIHDNRSPPSQEFFKESEIFVVCSSSMADANIKQLDAGNAHSALLTDSGELFLWGSNRNGQLGSDINLSASETIHKIAVLPKFHQSVEKVALGHSHTAVLERCTGIIHFLGFNSGCTEGDTIDQIPSQSSIDFFPKLRFVDLASGYDHTVGITDKGEVVMFGSQMSYVKKNPWIPEDGSAIIKVACGYGFTIALDKQGRLWTCGDNTYGQLGRWTDSDACCWSFDVIPNFLGQRKTKNLRHYISCGSYHCIVATREETTKRMRLFGWGRNDHGQLGLGFVSKSVGTPTSITTEFDPSSSFSCGLSSTHAADLTGNVWFCGEIGPNQDNIKLSSHSFVKLAAPISSSQGTGVPRKILIASGVNHCLAAFTI